jgi:cation transport ATPase
MKTTALAEDSAVSRMVRLVEEAQSQQSRTELLMGKIAKFYTPRKELHRFCLFPWVCKFIITLKPAAILCFITPNTAYVNLLPDRSSASAPP